MSFPLPLCSDGFSQFLRVDAEKSKINSDLAQATKFLKEEIVPAAAGVFSSFTEKELESVNVKLFLHGYGINLRHLGLFISFLTQKRQREMAMVEMVARSIRHLMRRRMREEMKRTKLPQDGSLRRMLLDHWNTLFLDSQHENRWDELCVLLKSKFNFTFVGLLSYFCENRVCSRFALVFCFSLKKYSRF
jgi:hypothetical protein